MSSLRSLLVVPFNCRRKSSSTSTSVSIDDNIYSFGDAASSSSPLPSSSPLLTPLYPTRPYECAEWQADDLGDVHYDQMDRFDDPWLHHPRLEHPIPYIRRPLPSLMTKLTSHTFWGDAPLSYSLSSFSPIPETARIYPQGDSAIADDCEEHDLESMNIQIRETYFATSAERGRWLSSPIASRPWSHTAPPNRAHSSPAKPLAHASPLVEYRCTKTCTVSERIATEEEHNEDARYSSPLPPSSPLSSPLSSLSFLGDDCEENATIDPCSNSDSYHSLGGTPELSISSTSSTSPVEPLRPSTPHKAIGPTLPSYFPCDSPSSELSCNSSLHHNRLPDSINAPNHAAFDSDSILSPLSQFELDLPEAEPSKLPLSDMENKLHSCNSSLVVTDRPFDVFPDGVSENIVGNPRTRRRRKNDATQAGNPSADAKKRRGTENHSKDSEPPRKKSKLFRCRNGSKSCRANSHRVHTKVNRLRRSPPPSAVEGCGPESVCVHDEKAAVRDQQLTQGSMDDVKTELFAPLTGMLVEALATSRATSMDSAALYLVLTRAHPYLTAERSKQELLVDIAAALEAGRVRCGMFEKVDSSGEGSRHRVLESRWFYIPERDEDEERATLISALVPRQKRNETKKYKQYYYRPLDKMSRWDAEDAP